MKIRNRSAKISNRFFFLSNPAQTPLRGLFNKEQRYSSQMFLSHLISWCIKRVASLGIVALLYLILIAFVSPNDDVGKRITNGQLVYAYYTIFIHILGVLFTLRLCWATRCMIRNLNHHQALSSKKDDEYHANLVQAIILPNYEEDLDTLRDTLEVLACHGKARSSYEVGLHHLCSMDLCGAVFFAVDLSCHGTRRIWQQR